MVTLKMLIIMFINALAGCIYIPSNVLKAIVLFAIVIISVYKIERIICVTEVSHNSGRALAATLQVRLV